MVSQECFLEGEDGNVSLSWTTQSEIENLGYHVYRNSKQERTYERLTKTLIEGAGSSRTPHTYQFVDRDVQSGLAYYYRIENVDFSGSTRMHGSVSVSVSKKAKPTAFALYQNTPNPFNPAATVTYDLPEASDVTLAIYTITGQKLAVLVDGHQEAGHHTVRFDGSGFANGVYLYRLETGSFVDTKRMVLIK